MERFVWIGPARQRGPAGDQARNFLRGLVACRAEVAAIDPDQPADPGLADRLAPDLEPLFAGPALTRGATCVYQGSPTELQRLADLLPAKAASCRVAALAVTGPVSADGVAGLERFEEIWVSSCLGREALSLAGVDRQRIHVLPPGIDPSTFRPMPHSAEGPFRFLCPVESHDAVRVAPLVEAWLGGFRRAENAALVLALPRRADVVATRAALVRELADRLDWFAADLPRVIFEEVPALPGARAALLRAARLFIVLGRSAGWPLPALEATACGLPLADATGPGALDFVNAETALLLAPKVPELRVALERALREPGALEARAALAREEVTREHSIDAAGRRIIERHERPYQPRRDVLAVALRHLGLRAPDELLTGCRSKVLLCLVRPGEDHWREPLQRHLAQHGPEADLTFCLWVDAQSPDALQDLPEQASAVIDAAQGPAGPADVQLMVAPADHVPWDRVEVVAGPPGARPATPAFVVPPASPRP